MNLSNKIFLEDFIFELHRRMSGDVWSWAGQTRRSNKNIGVDWSDIPMHLRYLVDDAKYWVVNKTFSNVHIAI